ncbi:MAG: argininosuccinate lyase [Clostridia bacterium]|nr:argininosuccinate lyase [Clostridia bacterium]
MSKLWGGRFQKATSHLVEDFHSSISFDCRLYRYDIEGSKAHARMLGKTGIISQTESEELIDGLEAVLADIEAGKVEFLVEAEDIHMNVELLLTQKIGETAKKLHTGRSRNDQVALDVRLFLRDEIGQVDQLLKDLLQTLLDLAQQNLSVIMPGYTHLQRAQPITLAHHLLAYGQMFQRDRERLADVRKRTNILPLGAGALAGTTYDSDPQFVADQLGFADLCDNSLDAVSDRDFVVEFCAAASLIMVHLSRFCEEIILWASAEFAFIELDDAYSTGSSMMPQKKNPDVAELIRGKSGRVFGDLMALLTMLKGLPLAYNKDMQEDKEALFDALDTVKKCLLIFRPLLATLKINPQRMRQAGQGGFTNASDWADYLVKKGLPFRECHAVAGKLVFYALEQQKSLEELSLAEFKKFCPLIEQDVYPAIALEQCVQARQKLAGPASVQQAIEKLSKKL